jgi:hypothetical protein
MNTLEDAAQQLAAVAEFFAGLLERSSRIEYDEEVALAA